MDLTKVQLFLDNELIESAYRLQRRVHPPLMLPEPRLRPEKPWEYNAVCLFGTVMEEPAGGGYRMYYQTFAKRGRQTFGTYVCLATSTDGLQWDRPVLNLVEFEGSRQNNIILIPPNGSGFLDSPSVILDPEDPDDRRRYKLTCFVTEDAGKRMYAAFSPDGVRWTWHPEPVNRNGDRNNLMSERVNGRYVQFNRHADMMSLDEGVGARSCWILTSEDFLVWTEPKLVLAPDLADPSDLEFYTMAGFPYRDQYVGWVQRMWGRTDTLDIELVTSRDGLAWHRLSPRETFIPLGPAGSWYSRWVDLPSNAPLSHHGELYWYVSGRAQSHTMGEPMPYAAIGLATQRADTMVSLRADAWEGQLTTCPIVWPGGDLWLMYRGPDNSPHIPGGKLTVRVLDSGGKPVAGYGFEETAQKGAGKEDVFWSRFRWDDHAKGLNSFAGKTVKLQFRYTYGNLHALKSGPEDRPGVSG
jgi:hypothetical protein